MALNYRLSDFPFLSCNTLFLWVLSLSTVFLVGCLGVSGLGLEVCEEFLNGIGARLMGDFAVVF